MAQRALGHTSVTTVKVFVFLLIAAIGRPTALNAQGVYAQGPTLAPSQYLPTPASGASNDTVVIERATLEQILKRLDSAESQIGVLQQGASGAAAYTTLPADPYACGSDNGACCDHATSADHADWAKYLVPVSTDRGDITFKPGLRIQPRYIFDDNNDNNDFLIRRFRLKASGSIFDAAWYGLEFKVDSSERFGSATNPDGIVENAWVDFTLVPESTFLRVGLYDIPFSRDALTSDSKLLFMDRTLIKGSLTGYGFADNTVGLMLHGRPYCGRFEYSVGVFDNIEFESYSDDATRESDQLMPAGRIAWNLLDPAEPPHGYADYRGSYVGKGTRLQLGANAASLQEAIDGGLFSDIYAWGVDLFFNSGPWVAQAEYDWFKQDFFAGAADIQGDGWYVQGGYYFNCCWELAARYQLLDPDTNTAGDQLRWTSIGLNYYIWEHNLKIQADYTFKDEQTNDIDNNALQVQLQLDY